MTLKELYEKRESSLAKMEGIMAIEEPTEDDQASFEALDAEIKAIDEKIKRRKTLDGLKAAKAEPISPEPVQEPVKDTERQRFEVIDPDKNVKGATFSKITRALAASKGIPQVASMWSANMFGESHPATKALAASIGSSGGFIVPEAYSADIIELLRAQAVVRRANPTIVPMSGTYLMPKIATGSSAAYVGENTNITKTGPTFGQIRLTSRKLAALVPISNDLLKTSSPSADSVVINDLVAGLANTEDAAFLRSDGTMNAPKGLYYWANSGNITNTAGTSLANIETDLKTAINDLMNNNVRMIRPVWFMAPRSLQHLRFIRDTSGNKAFPEVGESNMLLGYPIFTSNNIPTNISSNQTELYFVDMADAVIGEEQGIELMVSDTAAYHDGSNVVAAFSLDQTVIRAIMKHDFALRHDYSCAVINQITWGA